MDFMYENLDKGKSPCQKNGFHVLKWGPFLTLGHLTEIITIFKKMTFMFEKVDINLY